MARVLGIDFGERRVGLALSDPTATIAQPLPTLTRRAGQRAMRGVYGDGSAMLDLNTFSGSILITKR